MQILQIRCYNFINSAPIQFVKLEMQSQTELLISLK